MNNRGFTLVELVVTLLIIGVLAIVILPRFANTTSYNQTGFHDQLQSALQYARKIAVASRRNVCVRATAAQIVFRVDPQLPEGVTPNCAAAQDGSKVALALPGGSVSALTPPAGLVLTPSATAASFWFDPSGRASAAAITVGISGQPPISVEQETGYVH